MITLMVPVAVWSGSICVAAKMNAAGSPFTCTLADQIREEVQYFNLQVDNIELVQYYYGVVCTLDMPLLPVLGPDLESQVQHLLQQL